VSATASAGPFRLHAVTAHVFRYPLETPVVTSFGTMRDRPMVLVRAEDVDGVVGWGEIWCNFPAVGAEHRARLVASVLAPLASARAFDDPAQAFDYLTQSTAVLALQAAEPGPFAQAIAGIDIALWDLCARRAGEPLWRMLGGRSPAIRVYASGLDPDAPAALAVARREEGHRAFKLKIGFGRERDVANVRALRTALGADAALMVDANQAWTLDTAVAMVRALEGAELAWLEEPLRADRPWSEWRALRAATRIPLAAGENIAGDASFDAAVAAGVLGVIQPDLAKWGGFSRNVPLGRRVLAHGLRLCPHFLGGGIGLLASAHWLAAVGGDGMLEVDANPNPLRSATCGPIATIRDGCVRLGDEPGLGSEPDFGALARYAVPKQGQTRLFGTAHPSGTSGAKSRI
jgi:L-alanine-DL-glutamate epimerase-like enolase superfamily enzyme